MVFNAPSRLANRNFALLCMCNLFFIMSMHMSLPVLPLYLTEALGMDTGPAGFFVALYSMTALLVRPFSGYIVDSFQRRSVFLLFVSGFALMTAGYIFITAILLLTLVRGVQGACFGLAGTSINTIAVDFIPHEKLGTGIGMFGMLSAVSMALGPMAAMFLLDSISYRGVFIVTSIAAFLSLVCGAMARMRVRDLPKHVSLPGKDDLFLKEGLAASITLILTGYSFGLVSNFVALVAKERGIDGSTGFFFMFMAAGMLVSRFMSGRLIDRGHLVENLYAGKIIIAVSLAVFVLGGGDRAFFGCALLMGLGFGIFGPSYQAMFISLARPDKIGTANSTYYIAWDLSISLGIFTGGYIADFTSLTFAFGFAGALVMCSLLLFITATVPGYRRNRAKMAENNNR